MTPTLIENFELPPDITPQKFLQNTTDTLTAHKKSSSRYRQILFDTFDWRLYQSNFTLQYQHDNLSLCSLDMQPQGSHLSQPYSYKAGSLFWWHLQSSPLRDLLRKIIDIRALLPLVKVSRHDRTLCILNRDRKITAKICCYSLNHLPARTEKQPTVILQLQGIRGYQKAKKKMYQSLLELGARPIDTATGEIVFIANGKKPADYIGKAKFDLSGQDTSVEAVCSVMQQLLGMIHKNIAGIISDIDTEFLHDFRVAIRRTRSALSQIKQVFPADDEKYFKAVFARIGVKTNRLRDLDVYLLNSAEYEKLLPQTLSDGLKPLFVKLRKERRKEQKKVSRWLQSIAFHDALTTWQEFLDNPEKPVTRNSTVPAGTLAKKLIVKKYRRIIKTGRAITGTTPDHELHDLRIDCKQLRYLIEFFASLFAATEIKEIILRLKYLQNNLGEYNDLSMQQADISQYLAGEKSDLGMIAAIGGLITKLAEKQKDVRDDFKTAFREFDNPKMAVRFKRLFG